MSIISSNNNLDTISSVDLKTISIISFKEGEENIFETEELEKLSLSTSSSQYTSQGQVTSKNLKIYQLIENFNFDLSQVNIYDENGKIKAYLNKSEEVTLIEKLGLWIAILYEGKNFYISIEEITDPLSTNIKAQDGANLLKEPYSSSDVIKNLNYGESVNIIEVHSNWVYVKYNSDYGYIDKSLIELTEKITKKTEYFNSNVLSIIEYSKQFLGKPYVYGGTDLETGTDCSGFTYAIFNKFGINLYRTSKDQYSNGTYIEKENLQPGDLVFFSTGDENNISHIGIYIGNEEYIHSADEENGVIISNLNNPYSLKYYFGARRVL